ncbi:hypothetical protein ACTOB_003039 [Actinoplanes oblitus]|uniref:Uncharacterized protein n=1 Tax=Actinoplanes oblitus TaxID=3040509 RepID=A0ABY8WS41_9ACTN|nr:hypothetical protein [Actinoplanes oblitus]WIM99388.1 hypothetical protein ACTOB_003039 [Actinoplanes oblitus]
MKTRERYPIVIDVGTTFRMAVKPGEYQQDQKYYYDTTELASVTFQIRSAEYSYNHKYSMNYQDGLWHVVIPSAVTGTYAPHKSMYYVIDGVYASGDVKRLLEGPVQIRPIGGTGRF